jgi:hypothetical protein
MGFVRAEPGGRIPNEGGGDGKKTEKTGIEGMKTWKEEGILTH